MAVVRSAYHLCRCLTLALAVLLGGCSGPPDRPAATLPDCGWLPNCVNSQTGEGVHASEPIEADDEQWLELKAWIARQQDWEISIDEDDFLQAVVRTPVMRFRDDVQLLFVPERRSIEVRSSSRLGFSDLGTNARRVEVLRGLVAQQPPVSAGDLAAGSR
jgi:uncharacterized protein (DUF1499 family)